MLFNSFEFIFLFLPVVIGVFFLLQRYLPKRQHNLRIFWLTIASLFFYSWWDLKNLPVLLASMAFNYAWGRLLLNSRTSRTSRKLLLCIGIGANILYLAYFKYANFFIENIDFLFDLNIQSLQIHLPLGVSFFTFTQIAYLVDTYLGEAKEDDSLKYSLFVTFFPHLIAGPIFHHREVIPQLSQETLKRAGRQTVAVGLTIFSLGLFKKVVLADSIAQYANLAFAAAGQQVSLTFSEAWVGALAYTLQLYFDFSGYSDMAVGTAYMIGVRLPINFNSPYKASSISDFWRRWHITLSNFLRDYLYIPLGGNRQGKIRQYTNLLITMLLGGLWHGAGWTFIVWGGLHGVYLIINHSYRSFRKKLGHNLREDHWLLKGVGCLVTFLAVVISWVFFRSNSIPTAFSILSSMLGLNGIQLPGFLEGKLGFLRAFGIGFSGFTVNVGISQQYSTFGIILLLIIVWFTPNTYQWMGRYNPTLNQLEQSPNSESSRIDKFWRKLSWNPGVVWSSIVGIITGISLLGLTHVSEFLYFQF